MCIKCWFILFVCCVGKQVLYQFSPTRQRQVAQPWCLPERKGDKCLENYWPRLPSPRTHLFTRLFSVSNFYEKVHVGSQPWDKWQLAHLVSVAVLSWSNVRPLCLTSWPHVSITCLPDLTEMADFPEEQWVCVGLYHTNMPRKSSLGLLGFYF